MLKLSQRQLAGFRHRPNDSASKQERWGPAGCCGFGKGGRLEQLVGQGSFHPPVFWFGVAVGCSHVGPLLLGMKAQVGEISVRPGARHPKRPSGSGWKAKDHRACPNQSVDSAPSFDLSNSSGGCVIGLPLLRWWARPVLAGHSIPAEVGSGVSLGFEVDGLAVGVFSDRDG